MSEPSRAGGLYARSGKRLFDLVLAGLALLLSSPLMALLAGLVLFLQGRPVLFRQARPGLDGRLFRLLKFRTMRLARGNASDAERLTPLGKLLRRTSLDELPSLWNVVRGDMSLVGPRPLLKEYLPLYNRDQRRRHEVRPGVTGWAQVRGRNALTWPEKFAHDLWYVDHVSFTLDIRIMAVTLVQVIRGRGISAPEHATMPKFEGNPNE
ncbi:MAG: sugar transferase [Thermoanaerobaculia bacterium]